jgi:hypothetical protein
MACTLPLYAGAIFLIEPMASVSRIPAGLGG